ncbi:TetR family transcriptional regulator [Corynebacterium sp. HMSC14B06]|nr:TetR family transcriptional regulator [Corynebacterium amycolatum]OFT70886.1 TetR family transcriptional regulator [Corynebacterium sp. HMSC14B06]OMQ10286.1 TetR family transcriptional regulator [Corynebacterium amycolatum]
MTKDIIVDAALTILNEYGLGDLTIRRLTRHLGTAAGAMYWHYPSKQALLGAVADRILAPCTEFSATGDWRADIEAVAELLYSCLTAHRDGAEVVSAALATGTATIRPEQLLADVLENASETSISTPSVADTASVLVYFILGATVDQQTAIALNLNGAKGVSDNGDASGENTAGKDAEVEISSEDTATQTKELGRQRIALGTELFIAGIAGVAETKGVAGQ